MNFINIFIILLKLRFITVYLELKEKSNLKEGSVQFTTGLHESEKIHNTSQDGGGGGGRRINGSVYLWRGICKFEAVWQYFTAFKTDILLWKN
jgi:hypothetical protein